MAGIDCASLGSGVAAAMSDLYPVATSLSPVVASNTVTSTSASWLSAVIRSPSPWMRVCVPDCSGRNGERTVIVGAVPKSPSAWTAAPIALSVGSEHDAEGDAEHPTRPIPARAVTATRAGSLRTGSV